MTKYIIDIITLIVGFIGLYITYLQYRKETLSNNPSAKAGVVRNIFILSLIVGLLNMLPIGIKYCTGKIPDLSAPIRTQTKALIVVIDNENHTIHDISKKIAIRLKNKKMSVTTTLSDSQLLDDGIFDKVFNGSIEEIHRLKLSAYSEYLILGKSTLSYQESPEFQDMITAIISLKISIISSNTGNIEGFFDILERGAGFSKSDAEKLTSERILDKLEPKITKTIGK